MPDGSGNNQDNSLTQRENTGRPDEGSDTIKGTLLDLIALGKTMKCTFRTETDGTAVNGVTYVAGNKMRNDFDTTDPTGNVLQGHMISDGEWVYTWTSTMPQGIKMSLSDFETGDTIENGEGQDESNTNVLKNDYDYNCSPWITDEALFEVPSDIEFTDLSETLKNFGSTNENSMCAACDYAQSEEDRVACRQRLGCQ
jgi:hypothetical protein